MTQDVPPPLTIFRVSKGAGPPKLADIVFIHGLKGSAEHTWGEAGGATFWPRWLSEDLPFADVWALEYPADLFWWAGSGASMELPERARSVIGLLVGYGIGSRPLVFVTHSLGGLLAKAMLRAAQSFNDPEWKHLLENTRGIAFLGTPNTGAALGSMAKLLTIFGVSCNATQLATNSAQLLDLATWYSHNAIKLGIRSLAFYEKGSYKGVQVVDEASADPHVDGCVPIPSDANHVDICKPRSRDDPVYVGVFHFIQTLLQNEKITSQFARALLDTRAPSEIRKLRQLLFTYEMHDAIGKAKDPIPILAAARSVFSEPELLSCAAAADALARADAQCAAANPSKRKDVAGRDDFDWVRISLEPLLKVLPSQEGCVQQLLALPRELCASFLIDRFFSPDHVVGRYTVLDIIGSSSLKKQVMAVFEDIITNGHFPSYEFWRCIEIAQTALGDEFEDWFRKIRGCTSDEERQRYLAGQLEKAMVQKTALASVAMEFTPDPASPPLPISGPEAMVLRDKLSTMIDSLDGIIADLRVRNWHRWQEFDDISYRAKCLLQPYYPKASYRIHSNQITHWQDLEALTNLRQELDAVRDNLDLKVAGNKTSADASAERPKD
jgi:hypothetical protein